MSRGLGRMQEIASSPGDLPASVVLGAKLPLGAKAQPSASSRHRRRVAKDLQKIRSGAGSRNRAPSRCAGVPT